MKSRMLLLLMVVLASFGGLDGCKKKKSKGKSGKHEKREKEDNRRATEPEIVYGRESQEGTTAWFRDADKVFYIKATPHTVYAGQKIQFEGNCGANNAGFLTWNMGDNSFQRQEKSFQHSYFAFTQTVQKYTVTAKCIEGQNVAEKAATITITIQPGSDPNNPNQNPNQNPF